MIASEKFGIFRDDLISATELNRHPGAVLDKALEYPVTITRKDQAFALLPRKQMTLLTEALNELTTAFEVVNVAYNIQKGASIGLEHPFGWLSVFDVQELGELIEEVFDGVRCGKEIGDWKQLKALIYEWNESAIATQSQDLAEAFASETEEVPLSAPEVNYLTQ